MKKRVFVLTDGEDNASRKAPWEVAQFLQRHDIVLDAIPLADHNPTLGALCAAAGGLCFEVLSQEQGLGLFEREATLHVGYREGGGYPSAPCGLCGGPACAGAGAGRGPPRAGAAQRGAPGRVRALHDLVGPRRSRLRRRLVPRPRPIVHLNHHYHHHHHHLAVIGRRCEDEASDEGVW